MEGGICRECVCSQWWICSLSWELAVLAPSSAREIVELAVKSLRPLWWHWRETNVHNKRPKIHSFSLDWNCHFAAATSSDTDNYSLNGRDSINQGFPLSWTTATFVVLLRSAGSGAQLVLMKISGGF
ncbi:uncharacterized protein LOC132308090 isoform X2 [Cornus florida]|uniref:uncharacterized protein LOC132308090 isoform X2 n=1 Tax=Cornus florida TaxID=4283 RepID=UPI0028A19EC1|nr:uncharacterized protein LOC132308090 isoform X2 [Cornus florida]